MIQKQTIYLPVNTDDPSLVVQEYQREITVDLVKDVEGYFFTPEQLNEYTANVIKQALETAAEKAMIIAEPDLGKETIAKEISISKYDKLFHETVFYTSKQSITDTFDETFKKFKHD